MPPAKKKSAATASSVADTVTTIKEASPIIKRKEYYLVSTSIHFPDAKGDDIKFVETNTQPQLFSNERKAKDYLKEKAESIKSKYLCEKKVEVKTEMGDNNMMTNTDKDDESKLLENAYYNEVGEEQVILGIDRYDTTLIHGGIWGCLKFDKVVLNDVLPVVAVGRKRSHTDEAPKIKST